MNWFYESSGQQQGPVSESALDALIADGTVTPETRVWHEGMAEWQPLRTARPATAVPAASSTPVEPAAIDGPLPAGFVRCSLTGKALPESEVVYIQGKPYSAEAKLTVLQTLQRGGRLPVLDRERRGVPWDNLAELGFVRAAWETIVGVLFKPSENFAEMKLRGGLWSPLFFYLILGSAGIILGIFYEVLGNSLFSEWIADTENATSTVIRDFVIGTTTSYLHILYWALGAPLIIAAVAFLAAWTTHLALILLQGANQPFEATFRVTCYASGATAALGLIPFCGDLFGIIWFFIVMSIGLAKAHDTNTGRAFLAVILPLFVCCGGAAVLFGIIGSQIPWAELGMRSVQ